MLITALRSLCFLLLLTSLVSGSVYASETLPGLLERDDIRERSWTESDNDVPKGKDQHQCPAAKNKNILSLSSGFVHGPVHHFTHAPIIKVSPDDAPRGPPARI